MDAFGEGAEIETIVVLGADQDLGVTTSQYIIRDRMADVKAGIAILKKITGVERVIVAVPASLVPGFGHIGAEAIGVTDDYPAASPRFIAGRILGKEFPAGQAFEDAGLTFIHAEAVASIGRAFDSGEIPLDKTLTVTGKDGRTRRMAVKMGTTVGDLLKQCRIKVVEKDRVISGGLLTGHAVPTLDMPVTPDMNALHVQAHEDLALSSNDPCINCGECIRTCPTRVPVNMLVRFLEAGQYEDAADLYDLDCCIDCGLCSYVCVARIPIFQYIKLAKYELAQMREAEATDDE
jgi:electron transport complex protein RnfC